MKKFLSSLLTSATLAACAATLVGSLSGAAEMAMSPAGIPSLDHVFLIVMENQTDTDVLGNPNAPFINGFAAKANKATNYYAVGHPSAPNYLEIVGGSNFNLTSDYWPKWLKGGCVDNAPGSTGCNNALPAIISAGTDNAVVSTARAPAECNGTGPASAPVTHNCALYTYPATSFTPKSIAHQLVEAKKSWKSYQESLPTVDGVVDGVNYADGVFSNLSPAGTFATGPIQKLYAVKHNPFAYFGTIQKGNNPALSLARVQDFDGPSGLWADLQVPAKVPNLSLIVPNQCHDMHGFVAGGPSICASSATSSGYLMQEGDATVRKLVTGIEASPAWKTGRNVIVVVWDENDYSNAANHVLFLTETNFAANGNTDATPYDHYSLLKSLEIGFGLPCLNHACDTTSRKMSKLFGG